MDAEPLGISVLLCMKFFPSMECIFPKLGEMCKKYPVEGEQREAACQHHASRVFNTRNQVAAHQLFKKNNMTCIQSGTTKTELFTMFTAK